jgi:hypothetical protein
MDGSTVICNGRLAKAFTPGLEEQAEQTKERRP